eukprot:scaffold279611_cov50-Prasinocladus_malaysianus.AAC.1
MGVPGSGTCSGSRIPVVRTLGPEEPQSSGAVYGLNDLGDQAVVCDEASFASDVVGLPMLLSCWGNAAVEAGVERL